LPVHRFPRIEVAADSMRVGKTTAVKVIETGLKRQGLPVVASYEDWPHNPYLKASYNNPAVAFLKSQKWFAKRKYEQLSQAPTDAIFIQDLAPEGDYAYDVANLKQGRMNPADFNNYDQFYRSLNWTKVAPPDLLIYLTVSDRVLLDRAKKSARNFEKVDEDYFLTLKQVNREWVDQAKKRWKVLEIDTDNFNFASNQNCQEKIILMVGEYTGEFKSV
jgi:deoxyadenosine/deoxycytidine kinase